MKSGTEIDGRKRVLFFAEAVTLAHVARAFVLAELLDAAEYDVKIACHPRFQFLFKGSRIGQYSIDSISTAAFANALNKGSPVYDFQTLSRYAKDDIRVIEQFDPHVVIGDFRISLSASARVSGKPYITVTNAGWSPYARPSFIVPDIPLTRIVGSHIGQGLFNLARPIAFALHSVPLNKLRRQYGLPALPRDLRYTYTDADHVLYADIPDLIPTGDAPSTHAFLGPVFWSPQLPDPPWVDQIPNGRPIIYLTLGSSGQYRSLPGIISALRELPMTVVAATAGKSGAETPSGNIFVADFLDGRKWAKRASIVVCNGGSPTCYQALAEGVPVLGIPGNLDQYLNMSAIVKAGAGKLLRSSDASAKRVKASISELLSAPHFAFNAQRLGRAIETWRPAPILSATIAKALSTPCSL